MVIALGDSVSLSLPLFLPLSLPLSLSLTRTHTGWKRRMAIALGDPLRPEAKFVVQSLRRSGLDVGILSGDSQVDYQVVT
jgi:hypothetical protein